MSRRELKRDNGDTVDLDLEEANQADRDADAKRVIMVNSLVIALYDYVIATYPTTSTEVYTYKTGGASGTTVAIVTVVYTNSTKDVLTSVTKT